MQDKLASAESAHAALETTLANVRAELEHKTKEHDEHVTKTGAEVLALQEKLDQVTALKDKLEAEIAEGAEEAERSVAGMHGLEGKVHELESQIDALQGSLDEEKASRVKIQEELEREKKQWEEERGKLQSELESIVKVRDGKEKELAEATGASQAQTKELAVSPKCCHGFDTVEGLDSPAATVVLGVWPLA